MRLPLLPLALSAFIAPNVMWAEDEIVTVTEPIVVEVTTITDDGGEITVTSTGGSVPIIEGDNGSVVVVSDGLVVNGTGTSSDGEAKKKATELLNMDFQSAEGKAKLQSLVEKTLRDQMPRIQEQMAKQKLKSDAKLSSELGTTAEEFAAIQPLIDRVNNLLSIL